MRRTRANSSPPKRQAGSVRAGCSRPSSTSCSMKPGGAWQALHARVRVRRCHGLPEGGLYEMGVEIVDVIK